MSRELEDSDVAREIMEDPQAVFKGKLGNQNKSFEMDMEEAGERFIGQLGECCPYYYCISDLTTKVHTLTCFVHNSILQYILSLS